MDSRICQLFLSYRFHHGHVSNQSRDGGEGKEPAGETGCYLDSN